MDILEIIRIVWKDMVATPWGACLGLIILFVVMFKEDIRSFIHAYADSKTSGVRNSVTYTKNDVINHPIFRDLDYWLTNGIDLVKIEKSYAKELIMKDLLRIKFTVIKEILTKLVNDNSIEHCSIQELKDDIRNTLRDIDAQKVIGWRNNGIPEVFIRKYIVLHQLGQELSFNTMRVFLSEEVCADNYTRMYLVLSIFEAQLSNIYANAVSTALSLNGDLNGIIYKGVIIGSKGTMYAMDTPVHKELIEDKLSDILVRNHASRAAIFMFHDYPGLDPFDGKYSMVYECCAPGISEEKKNTQYMSCSLLSDYEDPFNKGDIIIKRTNELSYGISKVLSDRGSEVVATYSLKDGSRLKGFICLEWNYYDKFKTNVKTDMLKKDFISCAEDTKKLILGNKIV